ncbi:MAG: recombination mediator RecR [bacterium]|nr:recombination mediator RecR [bacterium]
MYSPAVQRAIETFRKLPGVGPKTAERYAFALLRAGTTRIQELTLALTGLSERVVQCTSCRAFAAENPCSTCKDPHRDANLLCVVAKDQDMPPIEKSGAFNGRFYVLGGVLNPLDDDAHAVKVATDELIARLTRAPVKEILLGLSPDMDGETTILYLQKRLAPLSIPLFRLARGIPVGAEIEYADEITLKDAIESRKKL